MCVCVCCLFFFRPYTEEKTDRALALSTQIKIHMRTFCVSKLLLRRYCNSPALTCGRGPRQAGKQQRRKKPVRAISMQSRLRCQKLSRMEKGVGCSRPDCASRQCPYTSRLAYIWSSCLGKNRRVTSFSIGEVVFSLWVSFEPNGKKKKASIYIRSLISVAGSPAMRQAGHVTSPPPPDSLGERRERAFLCPPFLLERNGERRRRRSRLKIDT